jgi:DNA processing protein
MARMLADGLGRAGYVVVSGLALGIDAAAHLATLDTGTVAVLAGGVDIIYPPQNADLHREIAERGCLISEMPPGFQPRGNDFPRRNRIISGLSLGVVIVEAARRSGSLITARRAADQGREVLAVPGHPVDPRAEGTNLLLKEGATLVTSAQDVIDALRPFGRVREFSAPPTAFAQATGHHAVPAPEDGSHSTRVAPPHVAGDDRSRIVAALGPAPINVDELSRVTDLPIRVVQTILLELSLAGRLEHHGGQLVSLVMGADD